MYIYICIIAIGEHFKTKFLVLKLGDCGCDQMDRGPWVSPHGAGVLPGLPGRGNDLSLTGVWVGPGTRDVANFYILSFGENCLFIDGFPSYKAGI